MRQSRLALVLEIYKIVEKEDGYVHEKIFCVYGNS